MGKIGGERSLRITSLCILSILLSSLFLVSVTAQTSPYDPWADLDDDGDIDIYDIVDIAGRYGTTGTAINKTALLLDLLERVQALENQSGWLPAPAYDSGWISITKGETIRVAHNLGTTEIVVFLLGKDDDQTIHQDKFGTADNLPGIGDRVGGMWCNLTDTHIDLYREVHDHSIYVRNEWDQVRVQMWRIEIP